MGSLRVLVLNNFAPPLGGAEEHVARLIELLADAGHEPRLLVPEPAGRSAAADRMHNRAFAKRLSAEIDAFSPDVLHVHNFLKRMGTAPFAVARRRGVPSVLTVHDYQLMCPRTWAIRADGSPCDRPHLATCMFGGCRGSLEGVRGRAAYAANALRRAWIARRVARDATTITAPAHALADRLGRALGRSIDVLPYPFEAPRPQPSPPPTRDLLFVGRVSVEKGLAPFLDAFARVPDLALTVAGDGPALPNLREQTARLGLVDRVRFLGRVDHQEIEGTLSQHGALVAPSLWMDNSPLTIHEALSAGRPVLGSLRGGIPELIEDGVQGFVFEPNDLGSIGHALQRYRELDDREHQAMARRAAERAARFGPAAFVLGLVATYRSAMEAERRP